MMFNCNQPRGENTKKFNPHTFLTSRKHNWKVNQAVKAGQTSAKARTRTPTGITRKSNYFHIHRLHINFSSL